MAFDLFGLVHKVDVFDTVSVSDGAGGLVARRNATIYANRKSRISMLSLDKDEAKGYGLDTGDYWQVVMEYSPLVAKSQFISISAASKAMAPDGDYRIVWQRPHQTEIGAWHHHQIICECESTEVPEASDLSDGLIGAFSFEGTYLNAASGLENALPTLELLSGDELYRGEAKQGNTSKEAGVVGYLDPSLMSLNRDVNDATGEFSFAGWFYPENLTGSQGLASKAGDITTREWTVIRSSSQIYLQFFDAASSQIVLIAAPSGSLALNQWNFIGFGIDDDEDVNGYQLVLWYSNAGNSNALESLTRTGLAAVGNQTGVPFRLGNSYSGTQLNGLIDGVHMWDRMLTDAEWAEVFNSYAGSFYPSWE